MTDLAQAIANTAPRHPVLQASDDTYLLLSGAGPFTVNLNIVNGVVQFASQDDPNQTYTAIQWKSPRDILQQNITFVFVSSTIINLVSRSHGLAFSEVHNQGRGPQQVGTVQATAGTYLFTVITHTGRIDPQIVVTPQ